LELKGTGKAKKKDMENDDGNNLLAIEFQWASSGILNKAHINKRTVL
jgi:hypothetical protein